jgi:CheY-like chemotaxis protein
MTKRHVSGRAACLIGVHVLVAEDDAAVASVLATALEYYGAWVTVAPSHHAGLLLLRTIIPRVLVVATSCAAGDGIPLLRAVRAFERGRDGRTATLALSGDPGDSARDTALMAGFQECLAKPVDPLEFCRVVARLVRSTRLAPGNAFPAG